MKKNQDSEFDNFLKIVGKNIREARKKKNMTQSQLALTIRVDLNTVSNIENGKYPTNLDTIYKIAKAFEVEPFRLLQKTQLYYQEIMQIRNQLKQINNKLDNIS